MMPSFGLDARVEIGKAKFIHDVYRTLLHILCHLMGIIAMVQEKNGVLEAANAELQKAAETVNAANANLQQKAAGFDELKVPLTSHLPVGKPHHVESP